MIRICIVSCLVTLVSISLIGQTVIIVHKTKDAIYVAADSRTLTVHTNITNSVKRTDTLKGSMCKIGVYKKFNFALSGGFVDVAKEEIEKASRKCDNFDDLIKVFTRTFGQRMLDTLTKIAKIDLGYFFKFIESRKPYISQIVFFGLQSDTLFCELVKFKAELNNPPNSFVLNSYLDKILPTAFALGHVKEIEVEISKRETWEKGVVITMNKLIAKQMRYHPLNVGGPIDIRMITPKKQSWIQKKYGCF